MAVSHIMLEAYKKYILVSLILHGKVQQLPKYTSQIVGRFIKVRMHDWWVIFFLFRGVAKKCHFLKSPKSSNNNSVLMLSNV